VVVEYGEEKRRRGSGDEGKKGRWKGRGERKEEGRWRRKEREEKGIRGKW